MWSLGRNVIQKGLRYVYVCLRISHKYLFLHTLFFLIKYCRKLNMYIEVSCFILFLIHISIIGYYQLYPTETSTRLSERKLDDLDFPVLFKICLNPAFNEDKIKGHRTLFSMSRLEMINIYLYLHINKVLHPCHHHRHLQSSV